MQVGSVCTRQVVTIDVGSTLAEAACRMRDHHVGSLVVTRSTSEGSQVVGIVTDRDLVVDALTQPDMASTAPIETWARRDLVFLKEDDSLEEAVEAMQARGVRRLLVRDATGHLCGVLSFDDLMASFAGHLSGLVRVLQSSIEREAGKALATKPAHSGDGTRFPGFGTGAWSHAIGGPVLP